jgi:hypothetical protein
VALDWRLGTYETVATHDLRDQLDGAPPGVRGWVIGLAAALRVDPYAPSSMMRIGAAGGAMAAVFADGRGVLTYEVLAARRLLVLLDLRWV